MEELLLIRHGQAEHMTQGITGGWTRHSLTTLGRRQARRAGKALQALLDGRSPLLFYCSDLPRASETAEIAGRSIGLAPRPDPALRDFDNGRAAQLTHAEAATLYRPPEAPFMDWVPYPEAESWRRFQGRVESFFNRLSGEAGTAVVVAHASVIMAAIYWWLQFPEGLIERTSFECDPGSLTWLNRNGWGGRGIVRLNDISHLAGLTKPS